MAASLSNRSRAMRNPTTHIFARGRGYIDLGEAPQLANKVAPAGRCNPAAGTADGSYHSLVPPGGHPPINFRWLMGARCWFSLDNRSKRLGYAPDYLSQAGWVYGWPVTSTH
jgi:hypothetical protein